MTSIRSLATRWAGTAWLPAFAVAVVAAAVPRQSLAQDNYPSRPIRMVIGFAAGGGTDLTLRMIASKLTDILSVPVIVENRPGANANVAARAVVTAPADGYTLLFNTSSIVLSRFLNANLSYDVNRDLTPVSLAATGPLVVAIHPSVPARTIHEFVDHMKANPGRINFASAGTGNITHLGAVLLLQGVGARANHVSYKGEGPAVADLLGGQVDAYFGNTSVLLQHCSAGKLRCLAVSIPKRLDTAKDIPTFAETVLPGVGFGAWSGVMAPANTSPAIVATLNAAINRAIRDPDLLARANAAGVDLKGSTVAEFRAYLQEEFDRWGQVTRAAGLKPE